jgi:F-type H+-transporting ATPase subunit b
MTILKIARKIAFATLLSCAAIAVAQNSAQQPGQQKKPNATVQATPEPQVTEQQGGQPLGSQLAEASREAAGEQENAAFKYSPSVRWLAAHTGLSVIQAYWVFFIINFAVVALAIAAMVRAKLPLWFRIRTETIQASMEEAKRTSADARSRLSDIEARLARIDAEIGEMRAAAEADGRREEERIRIAAEEDRARIIAAAEQEIAAISRGAQRELKAYAAELAVQLAERRIRIDAETDRRLVQHFTEQLSQNGNS